jgi:cytochrome oxidase assembly protein ShyY1
VHAIASSGEKKGSFSPVNNAASRKLLWLETEALQKAAGFSPGEHEPMIILEAVEPDNIPVTSYPAARRVGHLNEQYITPMTHLVYAFTWFSLCAAGSAMTYSKFFYKKARRGKMGR